MTGIEGLIPELQQPCRALIDVAGAAGVQPRLTSTLRTRSEQERLYKRYLSGASAYPAAPPGTSAHEFGYAFDLVVVGTENQNDLGAVWESWNGVWGGRARDPIHFEYPGFKAVAGQTAGAGGKYGTRAAALPAKGGGFYGLVDFLSGFVPWLGEVQLANTLADVFLKIMGVDEPLFDATAEFYLQHPAEAIRDLLAYL
jgi:hypothetical protein